MKFFIKVYGITLTLFWILPGLLFYGFTPPKTCALMTITLFLISTIFSIILYFIFKHIEKSKEICEQEIKNYKHETITLSRMAGIAENSTGVLHNIGNILNSINIASGLVAEKYKNLRVSGLLKAAQMMENHREDLPAFISEDPKGKLLPEYLQKVAKEITMDQDFICKELTGLTKNIEHIKEIVSIQQTYARKSGLVETVTLSEALEDAVRMNINNIDRNKIKLERSYNSDATIEIEKNKILQILINLVQNACQSLRESRKEDKFIFLELDDISSTAIIRVTDNGIGITEQDLPQIFHHGFTTKKNGNGFGLHCSKLLAEEMNGTLEGFSDGPDSGASFTLRIPLQK